MRRLELEVEWNLGPKVFSIYFSLVCGGKVLLHNTHTMAACSATVLTQDYRGGGGGRRCGGGRGDGARCHARVCGQPLPGGRRDGARFLAKLCFTLVVDNDCPAKAWGPCMQPYLGCFLPPDAEPDEAKRACELFRTRTA